MWMELYGAVDAPRRGPAAGNGSRRDRWGKEGGLVNIYIINGYLYSRIPPLQQLPTRRHLTHQHSTNAVGNGTTNI